MHVVAMLTAGARLHLRDGDEDTRLLDMTTTLESKPVVTARRTELQERASHSKGFS